MDITRQGAESASNNNVLIISYHIPYMGEKAVYIPVTSQTRKRIIKKKGMLTYDQYFNDMMGAQK